MTTTKRTAGPRQGRAASAPRAQKAPVLPEARHIHAVKVDVADGLVLRFFRRGKPWKLAELMPLVDSCGLVALSEQTTDPTDGSDPLWRHDVLCEMPFPHPGREELGALGLVLDACMAGTLERDSLNRLSILAGLGPREIAVWRAWVAYLQQLDSRLSSWQMRRVVRARPDLARAVWQLFEAHHSPDVAEKGREAACKGHRDFIDGELAAMPSAENERLWRLFLSVVEACVRSNVWQAGADDALAFKFDCGAIAAMPLPKPWREIFVYHPTMEGVHMRGGPVARGGLRHSDRMLDYRTEVLGLMTAQMRKNTIIIPVGAKGGIYVRDNAGPEHFRTCYRRFIRALLCLTDTINDKGKVTHPARVVCRDGDDPYLVVAADKGTARMSDTANEEACRADYWGLKAPGFWLGDAFASGGTMGYDHKGMAITARGAWISVMHHAAALGILPCAERPLSMVGIGDMGGDVFGNGFLRDRHVHLVAAFNHAHIFLDPNPDLEAAYAERRRLFDAGLGWDGYGRGLISKGGGVWPRSAKVIELSAEAQARLGLRVRQATPTELIQAILRAPVDAIWNGGIGTYIKASDEGQEAAADKNNDDVRVDGRDVRARIIGEGGNLGITPRGRVELALKGVHLNTDALDNSGGVSASDHEVNVKMLLQLAMKEGKLDEPGRKRLLKAMTDDIAALVLTDNHLQNMAVTLEQAEGEGYHAELLQWQARLVEMGHADVQVDCLPSARALAAREGQEHGRRYTRPELCGLLAATKAWLRAELLRDRELLASEAVKPLLGWYFPAVLQGKFADQIERHPLAREIAATQLANLLVNRMGILSVPRLMGDFDAAGADAARACTVACAVARIIPLWHQLDELEVSHGVRVRVGGRLKLVAGLLAAWVLRQGQPVDVARWLKRLHGPCAEILALLPHLMGGRPEMARWQAEWRDLGLPEAFASRLAVLSPLVVGPDAVLASEKTKMPLPKVLATHLHVGELLKLPALIRRIRVMPMGDTWARQAAQTMVQELFLRQRKLTEKIIKAGCTPDDWMKDAKGAMERYHALLREVMRESDLTVSMLGVVVGRLRELEA